MKVLFLPMYDDNLSHYDSDPYATIEWLLRYDSHLLMKPGELSDYAQGHKLMVNSEATITVLNQDEKVAIPQGDSVFIFFEPYITEGFIKHTCNDADGFKKVRIITVEEQSCLSIG